jgi:hypothetical protein
MTLLWGLAPPIVHELGHYVAALLCGSRISFYRQGWRLLWRWPKVDPRKLRAICQAGFAVELALVPLLPCPYAIVALAHFALYPWYAGDHSDFRGMI